MELYDSHNYLGAYYQFVEVLIIKNKDDIIRDSLLNRFEFCVELAWKSLAEMLIGDYGLHGNSTDYVISYAAEAGIIDNPKQWKRMISDANRILNLFDTDDIDKTKLLLVKNIQNIHAKILSQHTKAV